MPLIIKEQNKRFKIVSCGKPSLTEVIEKRRFRIGRMAKIVEV